MSEEPSYEDIVHALRVRLAGSVSMDLFGSSACRDEVLPALRQVLSEMGLEVAA